MKLTRRGEVLLSASGVALFLAGLGFAGWVEGLG